MPVITARIYDEQYEHLLAIKEATKKSISRQVREMIDIQKKDEEINFNIDEKIRQILREMHIDNIRIRNSDIDNVDNDDDKKKDNGSGERTSKNNGDSRIISIVEDLLSI